MAVSLELHEERRHVPAHVVVHLPREALERVAVVMEHDRARIVAAHPAARDHAVPHLGIFAAARGAGAETLVEGAELVEHVTPKGHRGTRADLPHPRPVASRDAEEVAVEAELPIALRETAEVLLEGPLRLRPQLGREHQPGDGRHVGHVECALDAGGPLGVHDDVVVGERNDVARRPRDARVARDAEPGPRLQHVADAGVVAQHVARGGRGRRVVDDDDLLRRARRSLERPQAARELGRAIARAHDHGDARVARRRQCAPKRLRERLEGAREREQALERGLVRRRKPAGVGSRQQLGGVDADEPRGECRRHDLRRERRELRRGERQVVARELFVTHRDPVAREDEPHGGGVGGRLDGGERARQLHLENRTGYQRHVACVSRMRRVRRTERG